MPGLGLVLVQVQTCSCCEQYIDFQGPQDKTPIKLFGCVLYSVCPNCGQQVEDTDDPVYRCKFWKSLIRNQQRALKKETDPGLLRKLRISLKSAQRNLAALEKERA